MPHADWSYRLIFDAEGNLGSTLPIYWDAARLPIGRWVQKVESLTRESPRLLDSLLNSLLNPLNTQIGTR